MNEITLDCRMLTNRMDAHEHLYLQFDFPDDYGMTLDALHDYLTAICEPTRVTFESVETAIPDGYARQIMQVFRDSAAENPMLEIH